MFSFNVVSWSLDKAFCALSSPLDVLTVRIGEPTKLQCNITALDRMLRPSPIVWFKQDEPFTANSEEKIFINQYHIPSQRMLLSVFSILDTKFEDSGVYICKTMHPDVTEIRRFKVEVVGPNGEYSPFSPHPPLQLLFWILFLRSLDFIICYWKKKKKNGKDLKSCSYHYCLRLYLSIFLRMWNYCTFEPLTFFRMDLFICFFTSEHIWKSDYKLAVRNL